MEDGRGGSEDVSLDVPLFSHQTLFFLIHLLTQDSGMTGIKKQTQQRQTVPTFIERRLPIVQVYRKSSRIPEPLT